MEKQELLEKYIEAHRIIVNEAIRHADQTGYLSFRLDGNYFLIENSIEFITGEFDRTEFIGVNNPAPLPSGLEVLDAYFVYLAVIGADNFTTWKFRKLIIEAK